MCARPRHAPLPPHTHPYQILENECKNKQYILEEKHLLKANTSCIVLIVTTHKSQTLHWHANMADPMMTEIFFIQVKLIVIWRGFIRPFKVSLWTKTGHSLVGLVVQTNTFYTLADDLELAMMWMSWAITEHTVSIHRGPPPSLREATEPSGAQ